MDRKRVYFIRHGESTWNDVFNKGPHRSLQVFVLLWIPRLMLSLLREAYLVLSGKMDR